eukprot:UN33311
MKRKTSAYEIPNSKKQKFATVDIILKGVNKKQKTFLLKLFNGDLEQIQKALKCDGGAGGHWATGKGIKLDRNRDIIELDIEGYSLEGCFPTDFPETIEKLRMGENKLKGKISPKFPKKLRVLDLGINQQNVCICDKLHGTIPHVLPSNLEILRMDNNKITGPIPEFLPTTLKEIRVRGNQLTGKIPNKLPPN